jgi:hypothetical protein
MNIPATSYTSKVALIHNFEKSIIPLKKSALEVKNSEKKTLSRLFMQFE